MPTNPTIPVPASDRELVVIVRPEARVSLKERALYSDAKVDVASLNKLMESKEISLQPLFGLSEERLQFEAEILKERVGVTPPDLSVYYRLYAPDHLLEELAEKVAADRDLVQAAYINPGDVPAIWFTDMVPDFTLPPGATPNFIEQQGYLNDADHGGIDARHAWTRPGGRGHGINIIDVEGAWRFDHDDLKANQGGVIAGKETRDFLWRNHGTAVLGVISGDDNDRGIQGICHDANISGVSIFDPQQPKGWGTAAAILHAANKLNAGEILLLEVQRAGPAAEFRQRKSQYGNIPVEWWPAEFDAIRTATMRGVLVVTAGGNGNQDLGHVLYDKPPDSPYIKFPDNWANPFRRGNRDSGSIIVGAGAPKTAGVTSAPELHRLEFSNFDESNQESIFDVQCWGERVVTCGFGNLQHGGGKDENFWYTGRFSGTSSAAAMVAGVLGCVQGIVKARKLPPLTHPQLRNLLNRTGRPQLGSPASPASKRIGRRPDLMEMIEDLPLGP